MIDTDLSVIGIFTPVVGYGSSEERLNFTDFPVFKISLTDREF